MVLNKLLGGSLVETVGKVIDSVHTSEEEKLAAKTKLKEIERQNLKNLETSLQTQFNALEGMTNKEKHTCG